MGLASAMGFSKGDETSWTSQPNGGRAPVGTLAYQAIDPDQNSNEQYMRSLLNYGGQQSQSFIGQGNQMVGAGQGYTAQPASYWSSILSGRPSEMTAAMMPEIGAANAQFNNASRQLSTYAPMGGGRANQMAQMPYQRAGLISNILAQARPQAAQNLANLGIQQQGLGINSQQLGVQALMQTLQNMLAGRGQDVSERNNNISNLTSGLTSVAAPFASAGASLLVK